MASSKLSFGPVLACLGLVWLGGCATSSKPQQMTIAADVAQPLTPGARGYHRFGVGEIGGGSETEPIGLSQVSNDALRLALTNSMANLGYLADDKGHAAYRVSATIVELDRPGAVYDPVLILVPVDLSVTARIHYTVKPADGGPALFDEVVATTGTASVDEAISPNGRVRKANEAAIRLNIATFLKRLRSSGPT